MITADHTEASTSRFVQTKQWRIHYNEAGGGHPVFFLHGTGPGATGWSNFNQNVSLAAKYRMLMVDFPGWGRSDELDPGGPRSDVLAHAIRDMMDALGIEKAALVGNSMGGSTAIEFASRFPERLSHLVTMGAGIIAPSLLTAGGLSEGIRVLVDAYREPTPENFRRLVTVMVYDSSYATDALMKQRSDAALANPNHLKNWLTGFAKWRPMPSPELVPRLMELRIPALFIHGRDDRTVHWENSLRAVGTVPDSRLVLLNRCGHWAQLEHAREF
ncbi:MAG: alpha/beta fold hydrolase, partial [Candidatus Eremiobacteraeota bacterium]|nr:alpha/beta fold hydrolase [Candidatus Eremiobacteraeota bacterium]